MSVEKLLIVEKITFNFLLIEVKLKSRGKLEYFESKKVVENWNIEFVPC